MYAEQSDKMTHKTYLIDGQKYRAEEVKELLSTDFISKREEVALSMIENPKDDKIIIELGCLYGNFAKRLRDQFPNSTIIAGDYLEEHLDIARLVHPKLSGLFKRLNAYQLELEDSSVDIVTFQEVIEHLEGAANAVKEINRVLKIGGELILSTPTAYYWRDMWQAFKYELVRKYRKKSLPLSDSIYFQEHEWNRHIYCWTPSTLYTLLKVNGFEYVTHKYCEEGKGFLEKLFLKAFPFVSPTIIIKVKKIYEASEKIV